MWFGATLCIDIFASPHGSFPIEQSFLQIKKFLIYASDVELIPMPWAQGAKTAHHHHHERAVFLHSKTEKA
jgi:hypothetical protein